MGCAIFIDPLQGPWHVGWTVIDTATKKEKNMTTTEERLALALAKFHRGQDELLAALVERHEARREARASALANGATIRFVSVAREGA